jgi:alkylated DNA repair dioxygenase AlkB
VLGIAVLLDAMARTSAETSPDDIEWARDDFAHRGFAKVSFVVPNLVKCAVAAEVRCLTETAAVRREMSFAETDHTPRRMRNVTREAIADLGSVIEQVYSAPPLLESLSQVVGDSVHLCPYQPEQFVITRLERDGDTHGWHWDDYSYALVWVVDAPTPGHGGAVQCVPGTVWNKERPRIEEVVAGGPVHTYELAEGDLYVMITNTTLHRVEPVRGSRRTIVNMAYASASDLTTCLSHETMDSLWGHRTLGSRSRPEPGAVG